MQKKLDMTEGRIGGCVPPSDGAPSLQELRVAAFGVKEDRELFAKLVVALDSYQKTQRPQNSPLLEDLRVATLTAEVIDSWIANDKLVDSDHPKQRPMVGNLTRGMTVLDIPVVATLAKLLIDREGYRWFAGQLRTEVDRVVSGLTALNLPVPPQVKELREAHAAAFQSRER